MSIANSLRAAERMAHHAAIAERREAANAARGEVNHVPPMPASLGGLTEAAFAREAAREARARGEHDMARTWDLEAIRLDGHPSPPWHETDLEQGPGGPIRLSFAARVF